MQALLLLQRVSHGTTCRCMSPAAPLGSSLPLHRPTNPAAALRVLNLNSNHLYGSIPKDLARLTSLEQLLLGGNRCGGGGSGRKHA